MARAELQSTAGRNDSLQADPPPAVAAVPATALSRTRAHRRRQRPMALMGLAASLVIAVGIAWQLRPLPPAPMQETDLPAPAAAPAAAEASSDAASEAPASAFSQEAEKIDPPSIQAAPAAAAAAPAPAAARARPAPPSPEPAIVEPVPSPPVAERIVVPTAPPAPPAPPAAAPAALEDRVVPTAGALAARERAPSQQQRKSEAAPPPPRRTAAPVAAFPASAEPADAAGIEHDAALPRRQWLQRIRERRDGGDLEGARASLRRFADDHPHARIPRDLRPLLEE
ncbi:hypothetical protein OK348_11475 [Flavobacterium sp. MXW15]|nr:hypothetical protein [Xanthomonas sp. H13-6]MCW4455409.1 hypothetical protein [Flavobacterium sp. MXW15]